MKPFHTHLRLVLVTGVCLLAARALVSQEGGRDEPRPITITSTGGAEMHPDQNMFVYIENVVFDHPEQMLNMKCDRLEVYREVPPPAPPPPPLEAEAGQGEAVKPEPKEEAPEIKKAIATGNVRIEKTAPDGGMRKGTGDRAVFESKTQEIRLYGSPTLMVDNTEFEALRKDCVVILKEDGRHRLQGPFNTKVRAGGNREGGGGN